jgi:DNA replication initiation complex subunit (GINS family)
MTYIVDLLIQNWREEQASKSLQALPATFTDGVKELFTSLDKALSTLTEGSLQAAITRKEVEMVKYLWNDLLKIRKQKLEVAVTSGVPVKEEYLLDFEVEYYRSLRGMSFKYDSGKNIFPDTRVNREMSSNYLTIRLLQDSTEFVGLDLHTYGPFKKEDVAYMPKEHAEILVSDGKAKRVMIPA